MSDAMLHQHCDPCGRPRHRRWRRWRSPRWCRRRIENKALVVYLTLSCLSWQAWARGQRRRRLPQQCRRRRGRPPGTPRGGTTTPAATATFLAMAATAATSRGAAARVPPATAMTPRPCTGVLSEFGIDLGILVQGSEGGPSRARADRAQTVFRAGGVCSRRALCSRLIAVNAGSRLLQSSTPCCGQSLTPHVFVPAGCARRTRRTSTARCGMCEHASTSPPSRMCTPSSTCCASASWVRALP